MEVPWCRPGAWIPWIPQIDRALDGYVVFDQDPRTHRRATGRIETEKVKPARKAGLTSWSKWQYRK